MTGEDILILSNLNFFFQKNINIRKKESLFERKRSI